MLKALDSNNELVFIEKAIRNEPYFCQICGQVVIQRRGEIKAHHFAHLSAHAKNKDYLPCSDSWTNKYDTSAWHYEWEKEFDYRFMEKVVSIGDEKHIADVAVDDILVEFQSDSITIDHFRERNDFFDKAGYKVIWVFDLTKEVENGKMKRSGIREDQYSWSYAKKVFKDMNIEAEKATIYIQTKNSNDEKVLERITDSNSSFTCFYTDQSNKLTKEEFINFVRSNNKSLFSKPKAPLLLDGGKAINELWDDTCKWIIVKNIFNNTVMVIHGKEGRMFREKNVGFNARIVGKYSNYDETIKRYTYEDEFKPIDDSEKRIWMLVKKETDVALVEKKKRQLEEQSKMEAEYRKKIEEEQKMREEYKKKLEYVQSIPNNFQDGDKLSDIISGNFKDYRIIKNMFSGEYYYFSFAKGMAFYDKVTSINKYNFKEKEIGEMLTDEEEQKLWAIKNKSIWEKI